MNLTDIISGIIEKHSKRKSNPETWEQLKKKLKKNGYKEGEKEYDEVMEEISNVGAYSFLQVWESLDKHINKDKRKWGGHNEYRKQTVSMIKELCKIDNIEKIIEVIGETGYNNLPTFNVGFCVYVYLAKNLNIQTFKSLAENELYKKCGLTFRALKKLNYKDVKSYDTSASNQISHLIELSKLGEDTIGAIYALASSGYQIDPIVGLSKIDIQNIEQIIEKARLEKPGNGLFIYLYERKNPEIFQEYFNSLEAKNKKSALKSILDYEAKTELGELNKQNREWLEKNYADLIREITFTS